MKLAKYAKKPETLFQWHVALCSIALALPFFVPLNAVFKILYSFWLYDFSSWCQPSPVPSVNPPLPFTSPSHSSSSPFWLPFFPLPFTALYPLPFLAPVLICTSVCLVVYTLAGPLSSIHNFLWSWRIQKNFHLANFLMIEDRLALLCTIKHGLEYPAA